MNDPRPVPLLAPLVVLVVTLVAFIPALDGSFVNWDDSILFTKNPDFRGLAWPQLRWMFTTTLNGHYMPLTWITLGLNYCLGGMNPWGYHLAAILLHAMNAVLLYRIAVRLLGMARRDRFPSGTAARSPEVMAGAAVAAALFAIHPQRVESVAWITERGTLVSGALYLGAVLTYLRAVAEGPMRWRWWGIISLTAFAASLLGKGLTITLPITLLILDAYPLRRTAAGWGFVVREKIPYLIVSALGAAIVVFARNQGAQWIGQFGIEARLAFTTYGIWFYPASTIWPVGLSPLHEVPVSAGFGQWRFLGPLLAVLLVTVVLVWRRHRLPAVLGAWMHSAVVVAPVSGIAQSGSQLVSDRYSYLAALGWALLAGYGVVRVWSLRREGRIRPVVARVGAAGVVLVITVLALSTWNQSSVWHDSETLWRWAVEQDPTCATCQTILGEAIVYGPGGHARLEEGEEHVRRAIALQPTMPIPYYSLGNMCLARGKYDEAESNVRTYIRLAPAAPEGPARLALIYLVQGRTREAIPLLHQANQIERRVQGKPIRPPAFSPTPNQADPSMVEAIRLMGDRGEDLQYLGETLVRQGQAARAVLPLERAMALAPTAPAPRAWLANAYEAIGEGDRARDQREALRRLDPAAAALPVH